MTCLLCQQRKLTLLAKKLRDSNHHRVVKCRHCGLIQLTPLPSTKAINQYYNDQRFSIKSVRAKELKQKVELSIDDTKRRVDFVSSLIKPKSRVLDYGFGYGFFLEKMRKMGYLMSGLELSPLRLKTAEKITKVPLFSNPNQLGSGGFDCLTLFHVLEHSNQPVDLLKSLKKLLSQNGQLVIEVPNVDDHLLAINRAYCDFYWKVAHLLYFNEKSLKKCLSKAGYKIKKISYAQRWNIMNLMYWMTKNQPQPKPDIIRSIKKPVLSRLDHVYKDNLINQKKSDTILIVAE